MYSSTLSLTSALDGVGGQRHALAALPPGKTRYPLYRRLGGLQGRSRRVREISPPLGFDPRTVQSVASDINKYRKSYFILVDNCLYNMVYSDFALSPLSLAIELFHDRQNKYVRNGFDHEGRFVWFVTDNANSPIHVGS